MQIKKVIRNIPPIYRLIAGLLILFGILVFSKRSPYIKIFEESQPFYRILFLQEGQYEFLITYEGFEPGDSILIYSDSMTDSLNQSGITLAETVVPEYAGVVSLFVTLSDGVHDVYVINDSKVGYFAQGKLQSVRLQNMDNGFLMMVFFFLAVFVLFGGYRIFLRNILCRLYWSDWEFWRAFLCSRIFCTGGLTQAFIWPGLRESTRDCVWENFL